MNPHCYSLYPHPSRSLFSLSSSLSSLPISPTLLRCAAPRSPLSTSAAQPGKRGHRDEVRRRVAVWQPSPLHGLPLQLRTSQRPSRSLPRQASSGFSHTPLQTGSRSFSSREPAGSASRAVSPASTSCGSHGATHPTAWTATSPSSKRTTSMPSASRCLWVTSLRTLFWTMRADGSTLDGGVSTRSTISSQGWPRRECS
mgnify:CR=1 FL=1